MWHQAKACSTIQYKNLQLRYIGEGRTVRSRQAVWMYFQKSLVYDASRALHQSKQLRNITVGSSLLHFLNQWTCMSRILGARLLVSCRPARVGLRLGLRSCVAPHVVRSLHARLVSQRGALSTILGPPTDFAGPTARKCGRERRGATGIIRSGVGSAPPRVRLPCALPSACQSCGAARTFFDHIGSTRPILRARLHAR